MNVSLPSRNCDPAAFQPAQRRAVHALYRMSTRTCNSQTFRTTGGCSDLSHDCLQRGITKVVKCILKCKQLLTKV